MLTATLGRHAAVVPSMILSSARWTPSPETSRVIDGLRPCARSVDLVDVDDPALRLLDVVVGVLQQAEDDVLDVPTDVPRLVRLVASHHRRTCRKRASVWASSVLPEPVGPGQQDVDSAARRRR
jgi:hypothetical protein